MSTISTQNACHYPTFNTWSTLLIQAVNNEKNSPELLPYPEYLIDSIRAVLSEKAPLTEMESKKDTQDYENIGTEAFFPFKMAHFHLMEQQRIVFILTHLLRLRISKIQMISSHITYLSTMKNKENMPDQPTNISDDRRDIDFSLLDRLSPNELLLAHKLQNIEETFTRQVGVNDIPLELSLTPYSDASMRESSLIDHSQVTLTNKDSLMADIPNFNEFVIVLILEEIGSITLDGMIQECHIGDIFLVQYFVFKQHLIEGKVTLL